MDKCPHCGSTRVYASRRRGAIERLRQMFTAKRPYRCHTCGWREWAQFDVHAPTRPDIDAQTLREAPPDRPLTADELDQLDLPAPGSAKRLHPPGPLSADEADEIDTLDPDGRGEAKS